MSQEEIIVIRNFNLTLFSAAILVFCLTGVSLADSDKYPYRVDFPQVKTIESYDLKAGLDSGDYIAIDARSKLEYEVIHLNEAKHIAISKKTFLTKLKDVARRNPGKKIAFYCNGTTCLKSYKATQKALDAGFTEVFAYDAGVPEWANMYPGETKLLGKPITDPEKQLMSKAKFKARTFAWSYFKAASEGQNVMVIDVRDNFQKTESLPDLESARNIPLNNFIPNFVAKQINQDKTLLIFDQVGKQVKWLQYYLEEYGYDKYIFLDGGATSVLKEQEYQSW